MKKNSLFVLFFSLLALGLFAEQTNKFIVEKKDQSEKTKKEKSSKVKQDIAQTLEEIMRSTQEQIKDLVDVQAACLDELKKLLEDDKQYDVPSKKLQERRACLVGLQEKHEHVLQADKISQACMLGT